MADNLFSELLQEMESTESLLVVVNDKNTAMFRRFAKHILQQSYSKLEQHHDTQRIGTALGVGITSAIQKYRGNYKSGSFSKSVISIDEKRRFDADNMKRLYQYIDKSDFDSVVKLVKITHKYGLKEVYRFVFSR